LAAAAGALLLKLLLDEHYCPLIADRLRALGHDVHAVADRPDLRGASDRRLLEIGSHERRTIVTGNVRDFARLAQEAASRGDAHHGILFTSDRSLPRSKAGIGAIVAVLDGLLAANPADDALVGRVRWVPAGRAAAP
jgi:hypothetical protein